MKAETIGIIVIDVEGANDLQTLHNRGKVNVDFDP
jgi:hypothetical protein